MEIDIFFHKSVYFRRLNSLLTIKMNTNYNPSTHNKYAYLCLDVACKKKMTETNMHI